MGDASQLVTAALVGIGSALDRHWIGIGSALEWVVVEHRAAGESDCGADLGERHAFVAALKSGSCRQERTRTLWGGVATGATHPPESTHEILPRCWFVTVATGSSRLTPRNRLLVSVRH
jgi:hypothetical protein